MKAQVERAESQIDGLFCSHPLTHRPFQVAAWNLLSVAEDQLLKLQISPQGRPHSAAAYIDELINRLRHPLRCCRRLTLDGPPLRREYDSELYGAAWEFLEQARSYEIFSVVFPLWHRRVINLSIEGKRLLATHNLADEARYEAYNRLIRRVTWDYRDYTPTQLPLEIAKATVVRGLGYSVSFSPKLATLAQQDLNETAGEIFSLPTGWEFSRYSLEQFRTVFLCIRSLATVWHIARLNVAPKLLGMGYPSAVWVTTKAELRNRVHRYTGVDKSALRAILQDLTYGEAGIRNPDPVIQPIIELGPDQLALAPLLWMGSSAERNLTVLINRLPADREIYLRLVAEKEAWMQRQIATEIPDGFEIRSGKISSRPDLPDIDLALISHSERMCILFELKWFIDPAEAREIVERSDDLRKGVLQAQVLSAEVRKGASELFDLLGITSQYSVFTAVCSENWIGHADVQDAEVPIIRRDHLTWKLTSTKSLRDVWEWLERREYLPEVGTHFEVVPVMASVGEWTVEWYGIKPLVPGEFRP
jgi:hypothetical protein